MPANLPDSIHPRVIIAGGGFGGINLAHSLKSSGMQVVMLDKQNHHTFQPLLYQVATSGLEAGSIAYPLRKIMGEKKNFHFRMTEVLSVDPEKSCIQTTIGKIEYDYLVLATGSRTNYFGMQDVEANTIPLKTVGEAIDLRHAILQTFEQALLTDDEKEKRRLLTFAIVGGGPTGVELAGALSELRKKVLPKDYPELDLNMMRIVMLDFGKRVLAAMSEKASRDALKYLQDFHVEVMLEKGVKSYNGKIITLSNGETLEAGTLIWAAGVTGDLPKGFDKTIIAKGNRLEVDEFNRVNGFENIFAIGDAAYQMDKDYPNGLPMLAPVAIQQGKHLAKNLMRIHKGEKPEPFRYFNKGSLATVGRNRAVGDLPKHIFLHGFIGWAAWLVVHLLYLIGFRNKLMVLTDWVWNYITYDRRVRLIIRPYYRQKTSADQPITEQSSSYTENKGSTDARKTETPKISH